MHIPSLSSALITTCKLLETNLMNRNCMDLHWQWNIFFGLYSRIHICCWMSLVKDPGFVLNQRKYATQIRINWFIVNVQQSRKLGMYGFTFEKCSKCLPTIYLFYHPILITSLTIVQTNLTSPNFVNLRLIKQSFCVHFSAPSSDPSHYL